MLVIRFGVFELNTHTGELRKAGVRLKVPEQSIQVLATLLERPGELVTREGLRSKLWPDDTVVEFDHSINSAVKRLRQALGDTAETPRFIETLPRRGYRFVFPLDRAEPPPAPARASQPKRRLYGVVAVLAVVCLGGLGWVLFRGRVPRTAPPLVVPFTTLPGSEAFPAFSPDGNQLADVWDPNDGSNPSIYIKLVGSDTVLRLTTPQAGGDSRPAWSPDGRQIAFCRDFPDVSAYYVISALGGPERLVARAPGCAGLDWFPDGQHLVAGGWSRGLLKLAIDTGQMSELTSPAKQGSGDNYPAISPDGTTLAFVRWFAAGAGDIYLMQLKGGRTRRLTTDGTAFWGLAWLPDSSGIVFGSGGTSRLWRLSASGGTAEPITAGESATWPAVSRRGNRLAYTVDTGSSSLARIGLTDSNPPAALPATRLIHSTRYQQDPQYSPDGRSIAYGSNRSGSNEIWVSDADGRTATQLTHFRGPHVGTPRWSPDGSMIAFDSRPNRNPDIFVVRPDGGGLRRMTTSESEDVVPSWSRDGKWIYFASDRGGSFEIWKVPAASGESTSTPAMQVTRSGGFNGVESLDGKYLYFNKDRDNPALWRLNLSSGAGSEQPILESLERWGWWTLGPKGIYFFQAVAPKLDMVHLKLLDEMTKRVYDLATLTKAVSLSQPELTVSPDGRAVVFLQEDESGSDIMLMEGFR
jgi:Tol biopolymer transport system component/DNA-binding winged helix-turn-helix (wHTH) protein